MNTHRITIRIVPTPAAQELSEEGLLRLAQIVNIPLKQVKEQIARGHAIKILTGHHPKIDKLVRLVKSLGFSVTVSPVHDPAGAVPEADISAGESAKKAALKKRHVAEWNEGDVIENLYEVRDIKYGGMGAVYIVRHMRWNTMLAVKSLYERLRKNEEDRALFVKEAETWIDIGFHPNIAACYYVRNILGSPRIFIEYVDGGGIHEWLSQREKVGWDLIIDLMVQVGDGLDHAHSKGLVHRDVKPANCLMTRDGLVKVTDFGLTKRREKRDSLESPLSVQLSGGWTTVGAIVTAAGMGTPAFMAPEMWTYGEEIGPPADIYAFGVMFFEICCGRKPFLLAKGSKPNKLALAHLRQPPPRPTSLRVDMPRQIERIILRCLEKKPENRYSSFREMRQELATAFEEIFRSSFTRERPDEVKLLAEALNNRAVSLMDLNHQDQARLTLEQALQSDPHHPEAVYNLGLLEWLSTGDPNWDLVVKMEEVVKTPEYKGRGGRLLGRCLLTLGDGERALSAWELSLSSEGATEQWLKPYAIALIGAGKDKEAIAHLETYLADSPHDEDAEGWLIGALVRSNRLDEARSRLATLPAELPLAQLELGRIAETFVFAKLDEKLVLRGHTGWVTCVCTFPQSPRIATGARDRTIRIWDLLTADELLTMRVLGEPPGLLRISPGEEMVAVAAAKAGEPVKIFDMESNRLLGQLLAQDRITALGFSPDGKQILTVEEKGVARLWDCGDLKVAGSVKIPAHTAAAVVFDSEARPQVFISGMDRTAKRINLLDSSSLVFEKGHTDLINSLKATPDGARVVTGGRDKQAIVWDGSTGRRLTVFSAHRDQIAAVAVTSTGHLVASYAAKGGIKVWDSATGVVFRTFSMSDIPVNCLAFTQDGGSLLAGGRDMALRIWDVRGRPIALQPALAKVRPVKKQMRSDREFKGMLNTASTAMKKRAFATAYSMIRRAQTLPGYERSDPALEMILRMKEHGRRVGLRGGWNRKTVEANVGVLDVAFSPTAINFLTAQSDHTVRMWSTKTGDCVKVFKGHTNLVSCIALSANGREALSGGDDRTVRMWDLITGKETLVLQGHTESVSSVAYSTDGQTILSGAWDGTVRQWRHPDGTPLKSFREHEDKVTAVSSLKDPRLVVSAGFDGVVKMWDSTTGKGLRDLRGHKERITSLQVSSDGGWLITGSMDGTVRIWDVKRGTTAKVLEVDETGVRAVGFSPEPSFALTAGNDAILRIWNVETGECLREFKGHSREMTEAEFSSNGRFVISASADGAVMIWELDWDWEFGGLQTTVYTTAPSKK